MNTHKIREIKEIVTHNENEKVVEIDIGKKQRKPRKKKEIKTEDQNNDEVVVKTRKPRKKKEIKATTTIGDEDSVSIALENQDEVEVEIGVKNRKARKKLEKIVYYVYCSTVPGPDNEIDDIIEKRMNYNIE